jgi:hypothetical protein
VVSVSADLRPQRPWGTASKFTIGVDAYTGERIAAMFNLTPTEVVDAYGRPCLQVEPEERLNRY